jgi:uncharacterized membrane protein YphA (DoxX/SURF4 family)
MNTLSVLQIVVAVFFLYAGGMKLLAWGRFVKSVKKNPEDPAPSRGLYIFIGIAEVAGALGLILPWFTGIMPKLTAVASAGLAAIMFLAAAYHFKRKEPQGAITTLILLSLTSFLAGSRWMF